MAINFTSMYSEEQTATIVRTYTRHGSPAPPPLCKGYAEVVLLEYCKTISQIIYLATVASGTTPHFVAPVATKSSYSPSLQKRTVRF